MTRLRATLILIGLLGLTIVGTCYAGNPVFCTTYCTGTGICSTICTGG